MGTRYTASPNPDPAIGTGSTYLQTHTNTDTNIRSIVQLFSVQMLSKQRSVRRKVVSGGDTISPVFFPLFEARFTAGPMSSLCTAKQCNAARLMATTHSVINVLPPARRVQCFRASRASRYVVHCGVDGFGARAYPTQAPLFNNI